MENYGQLTQKEKDNLRKDLENQGFEYSKVDILFPEVDSDYGKLLEFSIEYKESFNNFTINKNIEKDYIRIKAKKSFYLKI